MLQLAGLEAELEHVRADAQQQTSEARAAAAEAVLRAEQVCMSKCHGCVPIAALLNLGLNTTFTLFTFFTSLTSLISCYLAWSWELDCGDNADQGCTSKILFEQKSYLSRVYQLLHSQSSSEVRMLEAAELAGAETMTSGVLIMTCDTVFQCTLFCRQRNVVAQKL